MSPTTHVDLDRRHVQTGVRVPFGNQTVSTVREIMSATAIPTASSVAEAAERLQPEGRAFINGAYVADILRGGRQAHVALDAIASRTSSSREVGVRRMRAAGMVPSGVELALFEMMVSADHPQFKTISGLVRDLPQSFS